MPPTVVAALDRWHPPRMHVTAAVCRGEHGRAATDLRPHSIRTDFRDRRGRPAILVLARRLREGWQKPGRRMVLALCRAFAHSRDRHSWEQPCSSHLAFHIHFLMLTKRRLPIAPHTPTGHTTAHQSPSISLHPALPAHPPLPREPSVLDVATFYSTTSTLGRNVIKPSADRGTQYAATVPALFPQRGQQLCLCRDPTP